MFISDQIHHLMCKTVPIYTKIRTGGFSGSLIKSRIGSYFLVPKMIDWADSEWKIYNRLFLRKIVLFSDLKKCLISIFIKIWTIFKWSDPPSWIFQIRVKIRNQQPPTTPKNRDYWFRSGILTLFQFVIAGRTRPMASACMAQYHLSPVGKLWAKACASGECSVCGRWGYPAELFISDYQLTRALTLITSWGT